MQINKILTAIFVLVFGWCMTVNAYALDSQGNPVALLQYIANNMITQLKTNKATLKSKPDLVYKLAYRYVVPYADLPEMSKRVIPPQTWNSASAAQRMQFEKAFTKLLIRTYASALTSYNDQNIQFYPVRGGYQGRSTVEVSSQIVSTEAEPVHVTYRLLRVGSVWRLYDMSVEGVSLIESFRSQFADILSQGNMDALLKRISSHTEEG